MLLLLYVLLLYLGGLQAQAPASLFWLECDKPSLCPLGDWGRRVDAAERSVVRLRCLAPPCDAAAFAELRWSLSALDADDEERPLDAEWAATGQGYPLLSIPAELYRQHSAHRRFRVRLDVRTSLGVVFRAEMKMEVQAPPCCGGCWLDRPSGSSDETFRLNCSGWADPENVTHFALFTKDADVGEVVHLTTGEEPKGVEFFLPPGDLLDDFAYQLYLRASDSAGASSTVPVGHEIQVEAHPNITLAWISAQVSQMTEAGEADRALSLLLAYAASGAGPGGFAEFACWFCYTTGGEAAEDATCVKEAAIACGLQRSSLSGSCQDALELCQRDSQSSDAAIRESILDLLGNLSASKPDLGVETQAALLVYLFPQDASATSGGLGKGAARLSCLLAQFSGDSSAMPPSAVRRVSELLARGSGQLASAGERSMSSPLRSETELWADRLYDQTQGALPEDPNNIIYLEEMSRDEVALVGAKRALQQPLKVVAESAHDTVDTLAKVLLGDMDLREEAFELSLDDVRLAVRKGVASEVLSETAKYSGPHHDLVFPPGGPCSLWPELTCSEASSRLVSVAVAHFRADLYTWVAPPGEDPLAKVQSGSTILRIQDAETGAPLPLEAPAEPLDIWQYLKKPVNASSTEAALNPEPHSVMRFHQVQLDAGSKLNVNLRRTEGQAELHWWLGLTQVPAPVASWYSRTGVLEQGRPILDLEIRTDDLHIGFNGTAYFGVAEVAAANDSGRLRYVEDTNTTYRLDSNVSYMLSFAVRDCYFYDAASEEYELEGCVVGEAGSRGGDWNLCRCRLVRPFASGVFVPPSLIRYDYIILHPPVSSNLYVYAGLFVALLVFLVLLIPLKLMDRSDLRSLGVSPLPGNLPEDRYFYELAVRTGLGPESATDSRVQFFLSGALGSSGSRELGDPLRPTFRQGQTNHFVLGLPKPLGALDYLRIWHDNSGRGAFASWYLAQVRVRDLQTDETFHFLVNKWLCLEKTDSQIERLALPAREEEVGGLADLVGGESERGMRDGHLWLSVFTKPPRSRFNRVQRLGVCLCLLLGPMAVSALWYGQASDGPVTERSFELGPLGLSLETVAVGLLGLLILYPVCLSFEYLFRLSKRRVPATKTLAKKCEGDILTPAKIKSDDEKDGRRKPMSLPWWCQSMAWLLCAATVVASVFFVVYFGMHFGESKTLRWLSSVLVGFTASLLLVEPLKVIAGALVYGLLCGRKAAAEEEESLFVLAVDEEYVHEVALDPPRPLERERGALEDERERRGAETRMAEATRELILYAVFLALATCVAHGNAGDDTAFLYGQALRNELIGTGRPVDYQVGGTDIHLDREPSLHEVRNRTALWHWLRWTLAPRTRARRWYEGSPPLLQRAHLSDRVSRLLGHPILRQLRARPADGPCEARHSLAEALGFKVLVGQHNCLHGLRGETEEQRDFGLKWSDLNLTEGEEGPKEFAHRSDDWTQAGQLMGRMSSYGGGGYVWEMIGGIEEISAKLDELQEEEWLDRETRLLTVELNVFNAQANLFAAGRMVFELSRDGGVVPSARFDVLRLIRYGGDGGGLLFALEAAFCLVLAVFLFKELRQLADLGLWNYFREPWNWLEFLVLVLSGAGIGAYVQLRLIEREVLGSFDSSSGNVYTSLRPAVAWDERFRALLGGVVFLTTGQGGRVLRWDAAVGTVLRCLGALGRRLGGLGLAMALGLAAFAQAFHCLLLSDARDFATLSASVFSCFGMAVGGQRHLHHLETASWLAKPFFGLFNFASFILTLNIVKTLLSHLFADVRGEEEAEAGGGDSRVLDLAVVKLRQALAANDPADQRFNLQPESRTRLPDKLINAKLDNLLKRTEALAFGRGAYD